MMNLISNISLDRVTSSSRVEVLTVVVGNIIDLKLRPYFYIGGDWYNNMLVTSVEISPSSIDKLLRVTSNAWDIAQQESDSFRNDIEIDSDIILKYHTDFENLTDIECISVENGDVSFILSDDLRTEWTIIEA